VRRRVPTEDIERLARAAYSEAKEVHDLLHEGERLRSYMRHPGNVANGPPPPPMRDGRQYGAPGSRAQAKHDLAFWRGEKQRLLDELGTKIAEGTVVV